MIYYERLRELRESRNLSQKKVGLDNSLSQKTISQYETNARKPSPELIIQFAQYFNVSTDYILCLTEDPTPANQRKK